MNIFRRGKKYSTNAHEVAGILEKQNYRCPICGNELHQGAHFDHDHSFGFVRGILCPQCNMALGLLKENPGNCVKAADYLLEYSDWYTPDF